MLANIASMSPNPQKIAEGQAVIEINANCIDI